MRSPEYSKLLHCLCLKSLTRQRTGWRRQRHEKRGLMLSCELQNIAAQGLKLFDASLELKEMRTEWTTGLRGMTSGRVKMHFRFRIGGVTYWAPRQGNNATQVRTCSSQAQRRIPRNGGCSKMGPRMSLSGLRCTLRPTP